MLLSTGAGPLDASTSVPGPEAGARTADASSVSDAAAGESDANTASDAGPIATGGKLPPAAMGVDMPGPFAVTIDMNAGPGLGWVARPTELGKNGLTHPIFVWGPGAGDDQTNYKDHLERWASHGFVVYCETSTGNGKEMTAAIDWLLADRARSGSPYFQKLDTSKIAIGGHSRGSLSAFGIGGDPRLTTTIHVAGGGGGNAAAVTPRRC